MTRISLIAFAADYDSCAAAIEAARERGYTLNTYNDPIENAQKDVSEAYAKEVAEADPDLVYLTRNDVETTFVLATNGIWYVQRPAENQWGFELLSDDSSYPGGHGCGAALWRAVPLDEVPAEVRAELEWLLTAE